MRKERQLAYSNIIGVLGGPLPASKPLIGAKSIGLRMLAAFLSFEFKERSEELRDAEEKKSGGSHWGHTKSCPAWREVERKAKAPAQVLDFCDNSRVDRIR